MLRPWERIISTTCSLQLEARVEYSSFGSRHFYYPGDFHLSVCTKSLDQDNPQGAQSTINFVFFVKGGCRG
jgi:hypothetical protein